MSRETAAGGRIAYLDGLRGVAIVWVMLFHIYVVWPEPYGERFATNPFLSYGWLGVQLFFMISGYVILMTLDDCRSFGEFIGRRWLRLFPAMLVCSMFIYATATAIPLRPSGQPMLRDLLPGLTLMDPDWWGRLLGSRQRMLEGSFWSLFVEVKFYVIAAMAYFLRGRRAMVATLVVFFGLAHLTQLLPFHVKGAAALEALSRSLGGAYFGWFAAGAMYRLHETSRSRTDFLLALLLSVMAAVVEQRREQHQVWFFALWVSGLFALAVASPLARRALAHRVLLWIGFISYPLYLLHENLVVGCVLWLERNTRVPDVLLPIGPAAAVMVLAWCIAKYVEPAFRAALRGRRVERAGDSLPIVKPMEGRP